ncbi:MAG TPA: type II secretion system minor pseudopilin GspK [Steroidobacteraceae bacterium]
MSSLRPRRSILQQQRGMAMLVAILLVALGTILAAAIAYESAMGARRGAADLDFDEALLVTEGAEALAAYGLRAVKQADKSGDTYPAQPWAQPVGPIEVVPGTTLEASIEDLQGRFNLNSLVANDGSGKPNVEAVKVFQRLLEILQLEPKWADLLVDWIDPGIDPLPDGAEDSAYLSQNPPYLTANKYITSTSEMLALPGFGHDRFATLAPYVVALPPNIPVNICSAKGPVLDAFLLTRTEFSLDPQGLAKARATAPGCFPTTTEYQAAFESPAAYQAAQSMLSTKSNYFRLSSLVTIGTAEFNLYSLLYQDDQVGLVRPILRSYSAD